jgi:hypothetical protein
MLRTFLLAAFTLAAGALAAGCGEKKPAESASAAVIAHEERPLDLWPVMLNHCLSRPACDPTGDFGKGPGEASATWKAVKAFASSADGGHILLSINGGSGRGGQAGRPMTIDETPSNLRSARDRISWLSVDLRMDGRTPQPLSVSLRTLQLRVSTPPKNGARSPQQIADDTRGYLESVHWDGAPDAGMKVEISGPHGKLLEGFSVGEPSGQLAGQDASVGEGFAPWVFTLRREGSAELRPLLAAVRAGEALQLKITAPDGRAILEDTLVTEGYDEALAWGVRAMADPALAQPIPQRCAAYLDRPAEFWASADAPAAARTCNPGRLSTGG